MRLLVAIEHFTAANDKEWLLKREFGKFLKWAELPDIHPVIVDNRAVVAWKSSTGVLLIGNPRRGQHPTKRSILRRNLTRKPNTIQCA